MARLASDPEHARDRPPGPAAKPSWRETAVDLLRRVGAPMAVGIVVLTAAWSLVGWAVVNSPVDDWDVERSQAIAEQRRPGLDTFTGAANWAAESLVVAVIWIGAAIVLAVVTRHWVAPLFLSVALGGEKLTYLFSSLIVGRDRPPIPTIGHLYSTSSWPSGHVASAVTLYGSLALLLVWHRPNWPPPVRSLIVAAPVAIAVIVAFSRWYRGFHFVSDTVAGFVLGVVWLALATVILQRAAR